MSSPDSSLIVAGLLVLAGIVERFFAAQHRRQVAVERTGWARGEGVVSRMISRRHESKLTDTSSITESPVVRFRAHDGAEHEFETDLPVGRVGSKVVVTWNPAQPSEAVAIVPENFVKSGCGFVLIAIGLIVAARAWLS